jgi:hypothetical protein
VEALNTPTIRRWVHKTANVLNKLPKSQQSKAKRAGVEGATADKWLDGTMDMLNRGWWGSRRWKSVAE